VRIESYHSPSSFFGARMPDQPWFESEMRSDGRDGISAAGKMSPV